LAQQSLVRISGHLITLIDNVIENAKNEFGGPRFSNRREFMDEAVEEFLRENAPHLIPVDQSQEKEANHPIE